MSFVCFEIVLLSLNLSIARRGGTMRIVAVVAGVLGTVGVWLFLWVIVGDLLPSFVDAFDLPDPVMAAGPLLFLLGLMSPLVVLSWSRPRRLPAFAPVAVVLAFILIAANLDLLVLAALSSVGASGPSRGFGRAIGGGERMTNAPAGIRGEGG